MLLPHACCDHHTHLNTPIITLYRRISTMSVTARVYTRVVGEQCSADLLCDKTEEDRDLHCFGEDNIGC